MKCYLVILDNSPITSDTGPMEIFQLANRWLPKGQQIEMKLLSLDGEPVTCLGGLNLSVHGKLEKGLEADLIILGAIGDPSFRTEGFSAELLSWLKNQHSRGGQIASICGFDVLVIHKPV